MTYRVQRANGKAQADAHLLRFLHEKTFTDSADQPDYAEGAWWVAWQGDAPVAFAGLSFDVATPGTAFMVRAGVLPRHRGAGLQVRLLKVREAKARAFGCDRLVSYTAEGNIHSANSLMRAGFRLYSPPHKWGCDGCLYWAKSLRPTAALRTQKVLKHLKSVRKSPHISDT